MATIKLGAIITEIAGSIGGTTFRRGRNLTVMQNKQFGVSKNRLLGNQALPKLATIIQSWTSLASAEKTKWNNEALNFQFPDKFGDLKNLSGRELYIKLYAQNFFVGGGLPDVDNLSSLVQVADINFVVISTIPLAFVSLNSNLVNTTIFFQFEQINNTSVGFTYTRRKIDYSVLVVNDANIDFATSFFAKYPTMQIGDVFNIYIGTSNEYGFRSIIQGVQVVATG